MTSETRESSLDQGIPLKAFRFTRGALEKFYTSADRDITIDGDTYLSAEAGVGAAIAHTEIQDGGESQKQPITITVPKGLSLIDWWRPYPPGETIVCTILTQHYGEVDWLVDWIGRVTTPEWNDTTLSLRSEPSVTRAKKGGKGRTIGRGCDHVLYSQGDGMCNVDPAAHELPATLSAVIGLTLTASEFLALPAGRLAGGYVEWVDADGLTVRRSIESHPGNTITIDYGHAELLTGLVLSAYPGCGLTWDDCLYFANTDNYGGFLYMPDRDNYDGNPI